MKWSESAWQESNAVYEKIVQHPFNLELMNGTLHVEKFKFYIAQDSVYLGAFGRVLALIAARTNRPGYTLDFIRFSEGALVTEKILHAGYFEKFGLSDEAAASPACHHYTQFLLAKAVLSQSLFLMNLESCRPLNLWSQFFDFARKTQLCDRTLFVPTRYTGSQIS